MRRIALALVALALTAGTASAYVQVGHLSETHADAPKNLTVLRGDGQSPGQLPGTISTDPVRGLYSPVPGGKPGSGPANPVPKPGTMVLASTGLVARGTVVRRRSH